MKVKHLAFVAALAFTTPALAAPAYENADKAVTSYSSASYFYTEWLNAWTSVYNTAYGSSWTSGGLSSNMPGFSYIFSQFSATGTNFSQSFVWTSSTSTATYNMPVTAVPGPEAGAGLGALAMLGVAYWAKRRRNDQQLAA